MVGGLAIRKIRLMTLQGFTHLEGCRPFFYPKGGQMEQKDTRAGLTFVGFRANRRQIETLNNLTKQTGLSQSALLRLSLIHISEPTRPY